MAITAIKDFKIKLDYTSLVEKALMGYLNDFIYKPMFKIMALKEPKAVNSMVSPIVEALQSGKIYYVDGGFKAKAKFTNLQALTLEKWGAKWDNLHKMYRIDREKIPENVLVALAQNNIQNQIKINQIRDFLNDIQTNLPFIIDNMIFNEQVETILDDAGNEIKKNVKHLNVIVPELTKFQKQEISKTYTENMQFFVKDWTQERIIKMREKVQEAVLQGYRPDTVQKMLETEYGIGARKAKFLAQNETCIMLASYKKAKYTEMGFDQFIWRTIMDGKERDLHKELNGTTWYYDDPPVIDERAGEKGLPGQTYNCRCEAIPFRDNLPFKFHNRISHKASVTRLDKYLKALAA